MSSPSWLRGFALLVLFGAWKVPAAAAPVLPPSKKDVAEWVRQLGAKDFATRERAQRRLFQAGQLAEEALTRAAKDDDPEVRRRAAEILNKFKWGIYPNTPRSVLALIAAYQTAARDGKPALVGRLFDEGAAGCSALLKVVAAEDDATLQRVLYRHVAREAGRAIPVLLADKQHAILETLLEKTLEGDPQTARPGYAAYYLLRGKLDDRIAHFKKRVEAGKDRVRDNETLFYLYRARGDVAAAVAAADAALRPDLGSALLEDQARWAELTKRAERAARRPIERLGSRAAYHRLAGDKKELDAAVAAIRQYAEGKDVDGPEPWYAAKALFLNDRPDEALALVGKGASALAKVEILAAQMKFADALHLAEKAARDSPRGADAFNVVRGRILYFLGEKDKAQKIFAALGEKIKPGNSSFWYDDLVAWEFRLGLREQAFDHCARALMTNPSAFAQAQMLQGVFVGQEDTAQVWWSALRKKQASEEPAVTMKTLRRLLDGKIKGKELVALIEEAEAAGKGQRPEDAGRWLAGLAEAALLGGDETLAKSYFEKAAAAGLSPAPLVRWGDVLAEKKRYPQAAAAYAAAWAKDRRQPLPLYLRGQALAQAGHKKEGQVLMEQSHWLPLGDEVLRVEFARVLLARGQPEASRRERDLLLRTCPPASFQSGEAHRLAALEMARAKKYLASADLHERAGLRVLHVSVNFRETSAYVGVPYLIHRLRAIGLAMAGKVEEAKKELDVALTMLPGNPEAVIGVVNALDRGGHTQGSRGPVPAYAYFQEEVAQGLSEECRPAQLAGVAECGLSPQPRRSAATRRAGGAVGAGRPRLSRHPGGSAVPARGQGAGPGTHEAVHRVGPPADVLPFAAQALRGRRSAGGDSA